MRREFSKKTMVAAFLRSRGLCEHCGVRFTVGKYHYDHVLPDALGGEPTLENCEVICTNCHGAKTAKQDVPQIAKANRQHAKHIGARPRKPPSRWKRKADGTTVLRNP